MNKLLLFVACLLLAAPVQGQQQCAQPLSTAVQGLETEIQACQVNNQLLLDQYKVTRDQFTAQLEQQRLFYAAVLEEQSKYYQRQLAEQLNEQVVVQQSSGPGWLAWAIPTALSAAALIVALTHHHHHTIFQDDGGTTTTIDIGLPVIPRPNHCWPPGHCKGNK